MEVCGGKKCASRLANLQCGHVTSLLPSVFEELAVFSCGSQVFWGSACLFVVF